ncbi:hypothetical protein BHAOGJBA_4427 [Methylobacterium hispanicum]|uniref:Uncharacterized protein n=1 Tax=Methylobacterium hispanicum TaxID=270350 RepID=A0AAV4ZS18_9HYPH|nr:hypothetical protein [Methylobacterium hispanicum]GJD90883.1 hypothetical protein BHAOGJBA_4427 [Methylobacterium hispanicum]
MLADDVVQRLRSADPHQNAVYRAFAECVERAQRFVLTPEALGMTQSLVYGRPTTLMSAMGSIRSPYPLVWFEHAQEDVSEARRRYDGDDPRPLGPDESRVRRVGILVEAAGGERAYRAMPVVQFVDGGMRLMLHSGTADFGDDPPPPGPLATRYDVRRQQDWYRETGHTELGRRMARYLADDAEREAHAAYNGRFDYGVMPMMAEVLRRQGLPPDVVTGLPSAGEDVNYAVWAAREAAKNLVILNLKNGVEIRDVCADERSHRLRRRLGRPPLLDHKVLTLRMPRHVVRLGAGRGGEVDAETQAHWVRGHLKVRSTGVYWWSHHVRGDPSIGIVDKTYVVRP